MVSEKTVESANAIYASLAGGALWGLARLYVAAFSPTPPRKREMAAAVAESACAMASAAIGGLYVAPAAVQQFHVTRPDLAGLLSVGIGLGLWQSIPIIREASTKLIEFLFRAFNPEKRA